MPSTPYVIRGTIYNSLGNVISNALITFTTSLGQTSYKSNSSGKYLIDLANAGYTIGETISYIMISEFKNETHNGTYVLSGSSYDLNVTLSVITDANSPPGINDIQIYNIGGKPVSINNPFPTMDQTLPDNYDTDWIITRGDGQPDSETITLGDDSYKRTFSYTGDILTGRTRWVKQ